MTQQLPVWNNPGVEPPQSLKDSGWLAGVKPSAQHFNWLLNRNYKVMEELQTVGSQATIDLKNDFEYKLGTVVGRQLRLTRFSDVTRIPFMLDNEIVEGTAISVSLDGGATSMPLRDVDGNDVTAIPKGFGEVVASGNFFTLVNKGGSLTQDQLQALIDIVNEMTANDNDLRQSFISSVIATDPTIPLNTNSTWNQILTQIPNIKSSNLNYKVLNLTTASSNTNFVNAIGSNASLPYVEIDTSFIDNSLKLAIVRNSTSGTLTSWYDFNYIDVSEANNANTNYNNVGYRVPFTKPTIKLPAQGNNRNVIVEIYY